MEKEDRVKSYSSYLKKYSFYVESIQSHMTETQFKVRWKYSPVKIGLTPQDDYYFVINLPNTDEALQGSFKWVLLVDGEEKYGMNRKINHPKELFELCCEAMDEIKKLYMEKKN